MRLGNFIERLGRMKTLTEHNPDVPIVVETWVEGVGFVSTPVEGVYFQVQPRRIIIETGTTIREDAPRD